MLTENDHVIDPQIIHKTNFNQILAIITAGSAAGIITASSKVSLALLIFSGELSPFLSYGIGLFIVGTLISTLITGLTSSYPGIISPNEDLPAAIIAVMATGIVGSLSATSVPEQMYVTVVVMIMLTSLLTGVVYLLLGYFKLGDLFRFLPYPVTGGFIAGLGWLLASGSIATMANVPLTLGNLTIYFQPNILVHWLPGFIFAVVLLFISNRSTQYLVIPTMIMGSTILFYLITFLFDMPIATIREQGWLLGPFPQTGLWQPLPLNALTTVHWSAIIPQASNIGALLVVSVLALLLSSSSLELIVKQDIKLDQELKASGWGTIGSGLVGGMISYPALGLSTLGYRIAGSSRWISVVVAAVMGILLFVGPRLLAWTPKLIFGGLLMFLGLSFLVEWVVRAWSKFSRTDYSIVIAILLVIATVGFLQGIILGIVLATIMFVINYSRVNVIKYAYSGSNHRSRMTRCQQHQDVLHKHHDEIYVFQLQNFIFFGTAHNLLNQVQHQLERLPALRFILLDFRQVTGVDSTAILSFTKMHQLLQTHHVTLLLTHPHVEHPLPGQDNSISHFFRYIDQLDENGIHDTVRILPDLDRGLEWCENQILQEEGIDVSQTSESLRSQISTLLQLSDETAISRLLDYFEQLDVEAGYCLMKQGDVPEALYFIESGQVTAQLEISDHQIMRLETMQSGKVVGELGFYLHQPRTATVMTDEPSHLYRLSWTAIKQMEQKDPDLANFFHQGMVRLVSQRLTHMISLVNALQH